MSIRPLFATDTRMTPHNGIVLLDVGGTFIKCSDGRQIPVDSAGCREGIAASLREAVGDAKTVGVAIPGPFDYEKGIFLMRHKFASVYGERFADLVSPGCHSERCEGISFHFIHDVNAALKGENPKGNMALITLGTGLGFSYCIDGKVQETPLGSPARNIYNIPCGDGILEDYVSKRGILAAYVRLGGRQGLTVREIAGLAKEGDQAAVKAFSETAALLAHYTCDVLRELGIDKVIFGGQISRSFELMEAELRRGFGPYIEVAASPFIGDAVFRGISSLFDN